jgi:hypothetical protein
MHAPPDHRRRAADPLAAERAELARKAEAMAQAVRAYEQARDRVCQLENGANALGPADAAVADDDGAIAALLEATIDVAQAAERSGKSRDTTERWCALYEIGVKIAGRWRVFPDKLRKKVRHDLIV